MTTPSNLLETILALENNQIVTKTITKPEITTTKNRKTKIFWAISWHSLLWLFLVMTSFTWMNRTCDNSC